MKSGFLKNLLAVSVITLLTSYAFAQIVLLPPDQVDQIVGDISFGGNACPNDGAPVLTRAVSGGVVISYPAYEITPDSNSRIVRKSCNLALPIHVEPGTRVIAELVTSGKHLVLDAADQLSFRQELFFAGSQGTPQDLALSSSKKSFRLGSGQIIASPCGQDVIVRNNSSLTLVKAQVDSTTKAKVKSSFLRIKTESCQ